MNEGKRNINHLLCNEESLGRSTAHQLVDMACTNPVKNPPVKLLESVPNTKLNSRISLANLALSNVG